jgi:plastocyanin
MQPGRIAFIAAAFCGLVRAVPAQAETIKVEIQNLVYIPATVTAKVGDTIVWDNKDVLQHTATATDGSWNVLLPPKKTGSLIVKKTGTFDYFCKFHPNMKGKVVVTP